MDRFGSKNSCLPSHCLSVKPAVLSSAGSGFRASTAGPDVALDSVVEVLWVCVVPPHPDAVRMSDAHNVSMIAGSTVLFNITYPFFVDSVCDRESTGDY